MISAILPAGAIGAATLGEMPDVKAMQLEEAALTHAVEKRQREFRAGRYLARRALAALGYPAMPILSGAHREPLWPAGVVGSITHCESYCAAAVASAESLLSIGIDAEPNQPLPEGVLGLISTREERHWLETRIGDRICGDRLLFSAKESVFKAWFPLNRGWLDFTEVTLRFEPSTSEFSVRFVGDRCVAESALLPEFHGRYLQRESLVLTSVSLARRR